MPLSNRFPEWRDEQEYSQYPFEDGCSLTTTTGEKFERSTFIDAAVYVVDNVDQISLTRVDIEAESLKLYLGTPANTLLVTCEFAWTSADTHVQLIDAAGRACGVLVTDAARLSIFQSWGSGTFLFDSTAAILVAACNHAVPSAGVTAFELDDGSILYGDCYIVGDNGVVLNCVPTTRRTECGVVEDKRYAIQVHAVGDPLFLRKLCEPNLFKSNSFLQTLVFQKGEKEVELGPGEDGRIMIWQAPVVSENTILRVVQKNNKLSVTVVGEKL